MSEEKNSVEHYPAESSPINRRAFLATGMAAAASLALRRVGYAQTALHESLPSADEVWGNLETLVNFGPRYTGCPAHKKYVDFLGEHLERSGLQVHRDSYTLPRWQPVAWSLQATPGGGQAVDIPVTFYYPQSGETPVQGLTAPLVYAGKISSDTPKGFTLSSDVKGRIVFLEYEIVPRDYGVWYDAWGMSPAGEKLPTLITSIIAVAAPALSAFKEAGATGVVFGWTNMSDAQAKNQNLPFGHALQQLPTLWVGRDAGAKLRELSASGASATLTLRADVFPGTSTDTVYGILPGSSEEVLIINTHTDGPNAIQENGGIGLISLAQAFSKAPRSQRKRTFVFALTTGHYASAYVPSIHGFIRQHPEIINKTVASVAVEHLGCREWLDDAALHYRPTGKLDMSFAVTKHKPVGNLMLEALQGSDAGPTAVVAPTPKGRYLGEGAAIGALDIPTLGYFAGPSYLNMEAPDGCINKLDRAHMHAQIVSIAKLISKMDGTSAQDLQGSGPARKEVQA